MAPEEGDELGAAWRDALEAACAVERRPQLFLWMQTHLRRFVPHDLAICGVATASDARLSLDVFHGVPLAPEVLARLADPGSDLMHALIARCLKLPQAAFVVPLGAVPDGAALREARFESLLVQGVPSARAANVLESIFVFSRQAGAIAPASAHRLAMLLPQLHLMSLRVAAGEALRADARQRPRVAPAGDAGLTLRERQILAQAREGKRNAEIGKALGISGLTVKNHLQNILRKLGASNRAQAVAEAMSRNLLAVTPAPVPAAPCTDEI